MENQVDIWIKRAESKWLNLLSSNAEDLFSQTFLPSHDHTHHQRVWNICKNLLKEIGQFNPQLDESLVEGILIAAWFHDLGMVQSTREDHGRLGRELCEKWFLENGFGIPDLFTELLNAIELHDNKKELQYMAILFNQRPGVLSLLSIADDLEAFGTIGIYRYAEIYLKRHISLSELGSRILENSTLRYEKLLQSCSSCQSLIGEHQEQFELLKSFFQEYNRQLLRHTQPENVFTGPLGVINYIRTLAIEEHIRPEYLDRMIAQEDAMVKDYFKTLSNELDRARL